MTKNHPYGLNDRVFLTSIVAFFTLYLGPLPILKGDEPAVFLMHDELIESSGVGVSPSSGVIWSHNDSGDQPRLFAFSAAGQPLATFTSTSIKAIDWEDLCCFRRADKSFIAVGDVGDNLGRRKEVLIQVYEEPQLDRLTDRRSDASRSPKIPQKKIEPICTLRVSYPTGPVNCEALAYDPRRDAFLLATKELLRCRLFEVPLTSSPKAQSVPDAKLPALPRRAPRSAVARQTLTLPLVTGADIHPRGNRLAICTYGAGTLLSRPEHSEGWSHPDGLEHAAFELPSRKQGESICFTPNGKKLYLTSEFAPCPLFQITTPTLTD